MTPDDRLLAAELAIGLIDGAERAAALERVLAEPDFADEVSWWRRKLAPLLLDYAGSEAAGGLEEQIEQLLQERAQPGPVGRDAARWPGRWRWAAGGGLLGAIAASVATVLLMPVPPPPARPPLAVAPVRVLLVAPLEATSASGASPLAVVIDHKAGALRVIGQFKVPAGRSAELWRIGHDKVPVALGLVPAERGVRVRLAKDALPSTTDTIAISIEPEGGAPGPAPTGPVVASGVLEAA